MRHSFATSRKSAARRDRTCRLAVAALFAALSGCTGESTRIALQVQQRADEVQQVLFERQADALRILLFRDALRRIEQGGPALAAEQRAALSDVWNERDLLEFWSVQQERAKALRLIGVDAKLFGDQSPIDLVFKSLRARFGRAREAIAAYAGAGLQPVESSMRPALQEPRAEMAPVPPQPSPAGAATPGQSAGVASPGGISPTPNLVAPQISTQATGADGGKEDVRYEPPYFPVVVVPQRGGSR
ncbi:MAG: hypothetical protein U1D55_18530 [Phycisphaerae bacterium]